MDNLNILSLGGINWLVLKYLVLLLQDRQYIQMMITLTAFQLLFFACLPHPH